jgi:hypothetical protein
MGEHTGVGVHALLDAAPDAMVGVGTDGRILWINTQAEKLFECGRDEVVGQSVDVLVPDMSRRVHAADRARSLDDPRPRPMGAGTELAARRKDGSEFPAEISLSVVETDDGIVISAAVRDVTHRRRANAMFRGLLEAAPDAMLCVGSDGLIAIANAQAELLFGYTRDELIGSPVEMLVPDRARQAHPIHRGGYFEDPRPRPMGAGSQLAARRKDGSEFPAEISLSALETEDGILVSAAVRDVTERLQVQVEHERLRAEAERERLELRLQQSQRLESLGQLAGGVAHDFNNLLGVILNYAAFVSEELSVPAVSEEEAARFEPVRADVDQITRAADRATTLTRQLLAFARREVVRPEVLDLNDVIDDVQQLLVRSLGEHVELSTVLNPEAWRVLVDPGKLEQVLVNLAVNARDAMAGGGTLTIDTENVVADEAYVARHPNLDPGQYVRLRVSDTGTGMDDEVKARAFEPFYTTKGSGEGTGLGLATVYGIISQAGGSVQIYSEAGLGTTVNVLLPATDDEPSQVEVGTSAPSSRGGEVVLVVEDEDPLREVTCRVLTRHGYQVLSATCGSEALDLAAAAPQIDLLLTDVVMPQMLGNELAAHMRETRPALRVVFMSGYAQPVLSSTGGLNPEIRLIEKPFSAQTLLDGVRTVLDADPHTDKASEATS